MPFAQFGGGATDESPAHCNVPSHFFWGARFCQWLCTHHASSKEINLACAVSNTNKFQPCMIQRDITYGSAVAKMEFELKCLTHKRDSWVSSIVFVSNMLEKIDPVLTGLSYTSCSAVSHQDVPPSSACISISAHGSNFRDVIELIIRCEFIIFLELFMQLHDGGIPLMMPPYH